MIQVFRIMEGAFVGLMSNLVITPLILLVESVGIIVCIPTMIYLELEERNKIHIQAEKRLKAILERNEQLYHGITNDEQFY